MDKQKIIDSSRNFVKQYLNNQEAGHDWSHIQRVYMLTKTIAKEEHCDLFVAELGALFHDIADTKFNKNSDADAAIITSRFLESQGTPNAVIEQVCYIINHISFRKNITNQSKLTPELAVVMDADRLDAMGAIGIARAFSFGGHRNRPFYNPDIPPRTKLTRASYEQRNGSTINHFYEKLLHLTEKMNTSTGRQLAAGRHQFMQEYLEHFFNEWNGRS